MAKNTNRYVVGFAVVVCVICSAALAITFTGLKPRIDANRAYDIQKNVLKACALWDPESEAEKPRSELEALYAGRIEKILIDRTTGERVVEINDSIKDICKEQSKKKYFDEHQYLDVYRVVDANGTVQAHCFPTIAYGLWSWLYGFIALQPDCNQVIGISYYQDGETPGLGGEVNNLAWQRTWKGKKIFDDQGALTSVAMIKGGIKPELKEHRDHGVDGISGATMTSKGVTRDMKRTLAAYLPYIERVKRN